ncbi:MAG: MMPL family transporter [Streptomyces sp.]|nr:MMPL family transporter [Streptomyces sp.]
MRWITDAVLKHKLLVVLVWVAVALAGFATIGTTTGRLTASFALPGQAGYETNARITQLYRNGGMEPVTIATVTLPAGTTTASPGAGPQIARLFATAASGPGQLRLLDQATTGDPGFATADGRTAYAAIFTPAAEGPGRTDLTPGIADRLQKAAPAGWRTGTTGIRQLTSNGSNTGGAGLFAEILIGAVGALLVLAFVFASFLAVLPLLMALAAIPTTFLFVLGLTSVIDVVTVVQFLIGLIGLGVAIDYSLLVVTRWRESRDNGADNDTAVREAMATAGRAVILSGITVAVSLLALTTLPVPFLRSIGFVGFFIPLTSIAVAVTLLPVLLATIGPRLDRRRLRREADASKAWTAWGRLVVRHRYVSAAVGLVVVALLVVPFFSLRIGSPISSSLSQSGTAHTTLTQLDRSGVPSGVITPIEVLAKADDAPAAARKLAALHGVTLAATPAAAGGQRAGTAVIDVFPADETSTSAGRATLSRVKQVAAHDPGIMGVGGTGSEDVDFGKAVYGNFPLVLTIIGVVTFLLLTRALRSIVLAAKAVLLNLLSVATAYGVVVLVWQQGHGSNALWGVPATGSITIWVPVGIFAFLFGLSMDYEVFILTRMREAYDATGSTTSAIVTGIGRTGRLVTSAALILFLAFVSLASGPEVNIKILATGLGAGILIDAVVVRSLLVPAFVSLLGRWNWYLPQWTARLMRVEQPPAPHARPEEGVPALR